jgi:hypothetical protein
VRIGLRHAPAFAMVGWYMMRLPVYRQPPYIDAREPKLSQWMIMGSFDSADKCQAAADEAHKKGDRSARDDLDRALIASGDSAQCIATDDPRLKP